MSYEVLARKYRPSKFSEVVGQDHVLRPLQNSLKNNKLHQAYIFSGTRGVGKTTIGRLLAKSLNCESISKDAEPCNTCTSCNEIMAGSHLEFLEIDAASKTGVDSMRELLETALYKPSNAQYKIYLIDEVHMLSKSSFNALLKTLEEPPPHIIFLMATTEIEKVPKTVLSRCLQFNLKAIPQSLISAHITELLKQEKIKSDPTSIDLIAASALGSLRDGLTLLDQAIAYGNGALNGDEVKELLGTIDDSYIYELLENIFVGNGQGAHNALFKITELQAEYEMVLKAVINAIHEITLYQELKEVNKTEIEMLGGLIDSQLLQLFYEISINSLDKFHVHPNPYQALELCILRMLTFAHLNSSDNNTDEKKNSKHRQSQLKSTPVSSVKTKISDDIQTHENDDDHITDKTKAVQSFTMDLQDWNKDFYQLELSDVAQEITSQWQLDKAYENTLIFTRPRNSIDLTESMMDEFISSIEQQFNIKPEIKTHEGEVSMSPNILFNQESEKEIAASHKALNEQPVIADILKSFNGKINTDTIKTKKT